MSALGWLGLLGWVGCAARAHLVLSLRRRLELAARAEHELRGSLGVLTLGVEQLHRGRPGAELAAVLDAQLDRSRAGLGDLRAAIEGKPRRRGARPRAASVEIEQLARHTAAGWAPLAARAGRRLHLDWRAGHAAVAVDRGRLAQALGNLLSNAVEHGAGDVEVRSRRVGGTVRVEVVDRGGGATPPRARATGVREPSAPAVEGASRSSAGRGRGLAIADRAVQEAGGRLELRRDRDGTTAAFELPLEDA